MPYGLLADLIVLLHLAFVVFVVAGGLLVWHRPRIAWVHLPAALWGTIVEWAGWICPLTPFELWLRTRGGEAGYEGDFVACYLLPVLYPGALTREIQIVLGFSLVVINAAVYGAMWRRHRQHMRHGQDLVR